MPFFKAICTHPVHNTEYLFHRMLLSSGMLQSIWGWLTDTSQFTLYWFRRRQSPICQFRQGSDKKSSHLNRIILLLGILRWGRWKSQAPPYSAAPTLADSFNKGCEWQTYMTVGGWQNISFWFFTGEPWNKQQAEELNYKAKKKNDGGGGVPDMDPEHKSALPQEKRQNNCWYPCSTWEQKRG